MCLDLNYVVYVSVKSDVVLHFECDTTFHHNAIIFARGIDSWRSTRTQEENSTKDGYVTVRPALMYVNLYELRVRG